MDSLHEASDETSNGLAELLPLPRALAPVPVDATPDHVRAWFDTAVEASKPVLDGTLASVRGAAAAYAQMAKAVKSRPILALAHFWCGLPPLSAGLRQSRAE